MNAPISNPADCEVRGVIRFLQAENVRPSEIHRRLVAVYGEHVMNAASVRKWCTMFRNGRTDVHDADRSGRHSVITDALKQKVNRIIRQNRHFTISEVYEQCPEVSRTVVYEIVTEHLQYRKICTRWARRPSGTKVHICFIFFVDVNNIYKPVFFIFCVQIFGSIDYLFLACPFNL